MTSRITDRSRGMPQLEAVLDELENRRPRVTVGVHDDVGAQAHRGPTRGVDVVDVAVLQEFGSKDRAPSPYLRPAIDERRGELERLLANAGERAVKSAVFGRSSAGHVVRAFGRVANRASRIIQRRLRSAGARDTGHLLESIEGRVNNRVIDGAE